MGIPAIAFAALLYGILTPFGWVFFIALASIPWLAFVVVCLFSAFLAWRAGDAQGTGGTSG